MSERTQQFVGGIVLAGALSAWAYYSWVIEPEKQRQRYVERKAESSQRFNDWAYVAKQKEVAPGEDIKLVVIPNASGVEFLDTKCLIYTNKEFKTSSMICPDAERSNLSENDQ